VSIAHRTLAGLGAGLLIATPPARAQADAPATTAARPRFPFPESTWVRSSALYEVFVQDFSSSGDFQGVVSGLDRIQRTGANVVWLMPIFPIGVKDHKGQLGSPYAVRDYRGINPVYGTAADLHALIDSVHRRGMKLILDWVPDHTAADHPWVTEHPEYYVRDSTGNPSVPRDEKGKPTDWTDVVQLDYRNPELRRAMISEMRYWLDEFGVDGFRVDVACFVPFGFWQEALPALRGSVSRRLLFLAECEDPRIHRAGFDLSYAWESRKRLIKVWQGGSAASFVADELGDLKQLPPGAERMRFTTNHDQTAWEAPPVRLFRGDAGARAAFVAAALLPGRPLLYNGQEVDSPQQLPLFEREPLAWDQPGAAAARAFYHRVVELARTEPGLIGGALTPIETSAPRNLIAYGRGPLVVIVNPCSRTVTFRVTGFAAGTVHDLLSGRDLRADRFTLPPFGSLVLRRPSA